VHTDSIQLYGSKNTVIRNNYVHDVADAIMAPDGADHEVIEDNVVSPGDNPIAIELGSDDGSIIRHNTLPDGACAFDERCGIVAIDSKPGNPRGAGTIIEDNILSDVSIGQADVASQDYNLLAVGELIGPNDWRGTPTYVGGDAPTSYAGYALADGSLGKGWGAEGSDWGIELPAPAPPAPEFVGAESHG
jgi:hypothetical protein